MSPKDIFLTDKNSSTRLSVLSESTEFQSFLHQAFTQYCWTLPRSETPQQSWDANSRRQGALEFITTLLTLADPPKPRSKSNAGHLERITEE